MRISGFFRDAYFDSIAPPVPVCRETRGRAGRASGLEADAAAEKAFYHVFGSKPGAYGPCLQQVLDERPWKHQEDLARVYLHKGAFGMAATLVDNLFAYAATPSLSFTIVDSESGFVRAELCREMDRMLGADYHALEAFAP